MRRRRVSTAARPRGSRLTTWRPSSNAHPYGQRLKVVLWRVVRRQVLVHLLVLVVQARRRVPGDDQVFGVRLLQVGYEGVAQAETQVLPFIKQQMAGGHIP